MFVMKKYRPRVVGLIAAYAVLITGVVVSAAPDPLSEVTPSAAIDASLHLPKTDRGGCLSSLRERSEIVC